MHFSVVLLYLSLSSVLAEDKWTGKWFPNDPNETPTVDDKPSSSENWNGKWFPMKPDESRKTNGQSVDDKSSEKNWTEKWFPGPPKGSPLSTKNSIEIDYKENTFERDRIMGIPNSECDDAETNLHTDFDPSSADHAKTYTCLEVNYKPNANLEPIETIHDVPKFYTPVHKCMNETITYDQHIPTLGSHRPLWPMYGEYTYIPPQRWLHSLEHGAIVMLYDPCATKSEVDKLRNVVRNCLYRHVITPYRLSKDYPIALVAWATSLEMSMFNESTAKDFIKKYAKTGPEKTSRQGQYKKLLIKQAEIVSDQDDGEICPINRQ